MHLWETESVNILGVRPKRNTKTSTQEPGGGRLGGLQLSSPVYKSVVQTKLQDEGSEGLLDFTWLVVWLAVVLG